MLTKSYEMENCGNVFCYQYPCLGLINYGNFHVLLYICFKGQFTVYAVQKYAIYA